MNIHKETAPQINPGLQRFSLYENTRLTGLGERYHDADGIILQTHNFMVWFEKLAKEDWLPDTIFFLDKSARPLAYLFRTLFTYYCPQAKRPDIKFVNIGGGGSEQDSPDAAFYADPKILRDKFKRYVKHNGKFLIVDEFSESGITINTARRFLSTAFPDATISVAVAYEKMAKWQDNPYYLGVQEYTRTYYRNLAIEELNKREGTHYKSFQDVNSEKARNGDYGKFVNLHNAMGKFQPFTRRGPQIWTRKRSILERIKSRNFRLVERKNIFLDTRRELDYMAQEILKLKNTTQP